ncbi:MAG: hypothetical protein H6832_06460 [Planctomycetes bacterium]|nr:hypothetical protein [Planctomycetota bacterium]MCB9918029.1 hypothetical protein [Planctomycetota bacterium]
MTPHTDRETLLVFLLVPLWIVLGLWIDARWTSGQRIVDVVTWVLFVGFVVVEPTRSRWSLLACLLYATLGEVFLSLIWGLYDYRLGSLPLFVPPGHVLLFLLGRATAPRLAPTAVAVAASIAAVITLEAIVRRGDQFSIPLLTLFALALLSRGQRALFVAMFFLALAMELVGTSLGNWAWRETTPWLGLTATNPPIAVGAFYVVLDRLVTWTIPTSRASLDDGR